MRQSLLAYLGCPSCGSALDLAPLVKDGEEVLTGTLTCTACEQRYGVVGGVPRMNAAMSGLENVQRTFNWEWHAHHNGAFESETLFGRNPDEDWKMFLDGTGATPTSLTGASVLDAGCGSGAFTQLIAGRSNVRDVIGVDMIDAVEEAYAQTRDRPNVHIVQGNIFALPFQPHAFDLVWCNGVIHHTPDAARAHRSLCRHVRPGGVLYVWVYAKRFNPFRFTKDILDAVRLTKLPEQWLLRLVDCVAWVSLGMLGAYRAVRLLPGLRPRTAWGRRTVRRRTIRELRLTWFDALSPEYDSRHSEDEVIGWFRQAGFIDVSAIEEPKVGIRGVAPPATSSGGSAVSWQTAARDRTSVAG
jgi:SAM-dependent methyltransferase/uncharacterized protein YbaR (Trm112 family)